MSDECLHRGAVPSEAPPGAELIRGVNYLLDGTDTSGHFFPDLNEVASFNFVSNGAHNVESAMQAIPEPATPVLLGSALDSLRVLLRRSYKPVGAGSPA